jgi:O-antigen/teichoic acid export membrane protein
MMLSYAVGFVVVLIVTRRLVGLGGFLYDGDVFRDMLMFIYPLVGGLVFQVLASQTDKLLVLSLFGDEKFADYGIAALAGTVLILVASSITASLKPTFSRLYAAGQFEAFLTLWHKSIRFNSLVMLPGVLWMLLVASPLIQLFLGAKFAPAVLPFRVFLLSLPLQVTSWASIGHSTGHTKAIFWQRVIIFVGVVGVTVGLWRSGVMGDYASVTPAVGFVAGTTVACIYMMIAVTRSFGRSLKEVIPVRTYLSILGVAIVAGVVALPARWLRLPTGWEAALGMGGGRYAEYVFELTCASLVFWPVYLVLSFVIGNIKRGDMASFKSFLPGVVRRRLGARDTGGRSVDSSS